MLRARECLVVLPVLLSCQEEQQYAVAFVAARAAAAAEATAPVAVTAGATEAMLGRKDHGSSFGVGQRDKAEKCRSRHFPNLGSRKQRSAAPSSRSEF